MTASMPVAARARVGVGMLATGVGGALGATLRWSLGEAFPVPAAHFPWPTLLVNVTGAGMLAALPLLAAVRARPWLGLLLGTGLLGGFTTMSAASAETFALLDAGRAAVALAYAAATLAASVLLVIVVDRFTSPADRAAFESAEGDE